MGGGECVVHRGWAVSGQGVWLKERAAKGAWRGGTKEREKCKSRRCGGKQKQTPRPG